MATFSNQGSSSDTRMESGTPASDHSTENVIYDGVTGASINRGWIKWDLSSIPAGSTVTSAILSLYTVAGYGTNGRTHRVYRVLRAATHLANWNTYDGTNNWGTAGCSNTTSDREATDIGSVAIPNNPSAGTEYQFNLTASAVQEWINGTLTNNGFLIKVDTESDDLIAFDSSEGSTANLKPKLVIEYTPPSSGFFAFL
jgi:hypothetical protein